MAEGLGVAYTAIVSTEWSGEEANAKGWMISAPGKLPWRKDIFRQCLLVNDVLIPPSKHSQEACCLL